MAYLLFCRKINFFLDLHKRRLYNSPHYGVADHSQAPVQPYLAQKGTEKSLDREYCPEILCAKICAE